MTEGNSESEMRGRTIRDPHLAELMSLYHVLIRDYELCQGHLNDDDPAFWRRSLVRCVAAFAEGVGSFMRRHALAATPIHEVGRRSLLAGQRYRVSEAGDVEVNQVRTPAVTNIFFSFRCYAQMFGSHTPLNKQDEGWAALKESFRIRDRVMHPKTISDLEISSAEVFTAQTAFCYILNSVTKLIDEGYSKLREPKSADQAS